MRDRIEELRQNLFVIDQLIKRDKQRSLSSTFMGELWEIINPVINMVVMVLVFGKMFGGGSVRRFPLYVLTGTTVYGLFTSGTTMCLNALVGNKNFLIKTQLNKNVYIMQKIFLAFRNFLFSLMIYAFVVALYRIPPNVTWLLVIPDIFLLLVMMTGIGKILAVINVVFADITYFYKIFTLFLMYGSAIFYGVERMPSAMQRLMLLFNPLYGTIMIARQCIMENEYPDLEMWLVVSIYAVGCYVAGSVVFNRNVQNVVAKL